MLRFLEIIHSVRNSFETLILEFFFLENPQQVNSGCFHLNKTCILLSMYISNYNKLYRFQDISTSFLIFCTLVFNWMVFPRDFRSPACSGYFIMVLCLLILCGAINCFYQIYGFKQIHIKVLNVATYYMRISLPGLWRFSNTFQLTV